jgi:uncharacterized membrane protein YqhA
MSEHVHESGERSIFKNRWIMIPIILVSVAGAVVTIAGGFLTVFKVVTWIGNN